MMIEAALRQTGWGIDDFILIPAPIEHPDDLAGFLPPPELAVFLTTIYDEWGEEKTRRLESLGYRSETMWRRSDSERLTSGTEVRALMRRNQPWEHLVPEAVAAYIHRRGISA
jgi:nicotinamide-nucleotide adenylyltransferase/phosphinothricin biosynthesis protein PhpF